MRLRPYRAGDFQDDTHGGPTDETYGHPAVCGRCGRWDNSLTPAGECMTCAHAAMGDAYPDQCPSCGMPQNRFGPCEDCYPRGGN